MIHTKEDYLKEMKKQNMIPQKEANKIYNEAKKRNRKEYDKPSDNAMRFMHHINSKYKGQKKIKLSGGEVREMEKLGVSFRNVDGKRIDKGGF